MSLWRAGTCNWRKVILRAGISTSAASSSSKPFQTNPGPRYGRRRRRRQLPAFTLVKPRDVNKDAAWSSVFQTARSYDPYIIPLPIRMGRAEKGSVSPPVIGNLELMKIPNFFHLTPPAIRKHCAALKPLCTEWPKKLPCLPLRIETRNFVFPGHSVRHAGSRRVILTFKLKDLTLTEHSKDKMLKLVGERYDSQTDTVTLVGDRYCVEVEQFGRTTNFASISQCSCPTRKQNRDYVMYLLKVLYLESNKIEPWEQQNEDSDSIG